MMSEITFESLWLSQEILQAIEAKWYKNPSAIQAWVIPLALSSDKDIVWQAQTWSGKTAAFGLPILDRLDKNSNKIQALILTPTRELAIQVAEEIKSFANFKTNITLLYWGQNIRSEMAALKQNPQIIVWTPWRVTDHLNKWRLNIDSIKYFVLDEADEMLNVWFKEEIEEILKFSPKDKKVFLFSATMPPFIESIIKKYLREYETVNIKKSQLTNELITQVYYEAPRGHKFDVMCRILDVSPEFYWIVFCRTKAETDEVASKLSQKWYLAEAIHWDIEQNMREKVLNRFKKRHISILVATDVAARWIDVSDLSHVVNFELPDNPETYTHRIWRTGRAWKSWIAISLVSSADTRKLFFIERTIKAKIDKKPLPTPKDIISHKKDNLIKDINTIIASNELNYYELAWELLNMFEDKNVLLASLLQKFYKEELKEDHYKNLEWRNSESKDRWDRDSRDRDSRPSRDDGMMRLFVAKWKLDWFQNPGNLLAYIAKETWLWDLWAWKVDILTSFSYIDLPEDNAKIVLKVFKDLNDAKPLIVKAKEKSESSWGWYRSGWYRSWGDRDRNSGGERRSSWGWYRSWGDRNRNWGDDRRSSWGWYRSNDRDKKRY